MQTPPPDTNRYNHFVARRALMVVLCLLVAVAQTLALESLQNTTAQQRGCVELLNHANSGPGIQANTANPRVVDYGRLRAPVDSLFSAGVACQTPEGASPLAADEHCWRVFSDAGHIDTGRSPPPSRS